MSNKKLKQKSYHFTKNELKHPEKLTGKRLIELLKNKRVPHSNYRRADLLKLVQLSKLSTAKLKDIVKNSGNTKYKSLKKNELVSNALSAFSTTKLKRSHKKSLDALNKTESKYKAVTEEIMKKFPETKKFIEKKMEGHDNLIKTYSEDVQKVKDTLENAPEFKDLSGGGVAGTRPENEREYKKRIKKEKREEKEREEMNKKKVEEVEDDDPFLRHYLENYKTMTIFNIPVQVEFLNEKTGKNEYRFVNRQVSKETGNKITEEDIEDAKEYVQVLMWDKYGVTVISVEVDNKDIQKFEEVTRSQVKNNSKKFGYSFLENVAFDELCKGGKNCMINFTVLSLAGKDGFINFTAQVMKKQLKQLDIPYAEGITVDEYIKWIQTFHPNTISFYAVDPLRQMFTRYVHENLRNVYHGVHYTLCGLINNNHIYPIVDKKFVDIVKRTHKLPEYLDVSYYFNSDKYYYVRQTGDQIQGLEEEPTEEETENEIKYNNLVDGTLDKSKYDVILYDGDMMKLAAVIINKHKLFASVNIRNSELVGFEHPITGQIIHQCSNYEESKEVCALLSIKYDNCYNFKFRNQSWTQIAREIFKINFGEFPIKSMADKKTIEISDRYNTHPLINTLVDNFYKDKSCFGFDYKKSYSNAIRNMQNDYPIFSIFDEFRPFVKREFTNEEGYLNLPASEFLVEPFEIKQLGGVKFDRQILSYGFVKWLLEKEYITLDKLKFIRKASYVLDRKILIDFVEKVYEIFPVDKYESYGKYIVNSFIGWLGKKYVSKDTGCVTDSFDMVSALFNDYAMSNNNKLFNHLKVKDLYFVRLTEKTRITSGDYTPIWRAIICEGMINLLTLINDVYDPKTSQLIGYNTDSCFIQSPKECQLVEQIINDDSHPTYHQEDWKPKKFKDFVYSTEFKDIYTTLGKWNVIDEVHYNEDKILINGKESDRTYLEKLKGMSFMCNGIPGCQKTTLLKSLYNKDDSLALCFSNKACDNLIKDGIEASTFDSYFYSHSKIPDTIKRIQIDEYSMIPVHWIHILYELKRKQPDLIIQLYGDFNQCPQVDSRYFDYMNQRIIRELCGYNLMNKTYNVACGRYNNNLYKVLECLLNSNQLHPYLEKPEVNFLSHMRETNICYTNDTRERINATYVKEFKDWKVGMKVICNKNFKKLNVYNSRIYYIHSIIGTNLTISTELNGNPIMIKTKKEESERPITISYKFFDPAYCVTCYKYQGATIEEDINIWDVEIMSLNELYTAMSRCRKETQIHLKYTDKIFKRVTELTYPTKILLPKRNKITMKFEKPKWNQIHMKKVKLGYIYQLNNSDVKESYVGLTKQTIEDRLNQHVRSNPKIITKKGTWTTNQLAKLYYTEKTQLNNLETRFINDYQGDYKLINELKVKKNSFEKKISVGDVYIADTNRYMWKECKDMFRIQYRDAEGNKKALKAKFGKTQTKEKALEIIEGKRKTLINKEIYDIDVENDMTLNFDD